jgi:hypothetical protein
MPTSPAITNSPSGVDRVRQEGISRLRQGGNPFTFSVATAGSGRNCISYDVPELWDSQRADLRAILALYRRENEPTRLYPILGESGAGKTHLLTTFQAELQSKAEGEGSENLVVVADHFSPGLDVVDFFLWQIVNHLLAGRGPGARLLRVVADRATARLLGEALRRQPPTAQIHLIPPGSMWERLRLWWGSAKLAEARLAALSDLVDRCGAPVASDLAGSCTATGLDPQRAWEEVDAYLERTEPRGAAGWLRRRLYAALARLALLGDGEAVEDFLGEGYREEGPQYVKDAGQLGRCLLTGLLELFQALRIPVVLVFDQIEDFVAADDNARQKERITAFGRALAALVNNVPGLCLLVFAERNRWSELLLNLDNYSVSRINQDFNLPGRPSRRFIEMPNSVPREHLGRIIERRVRAALGDFDPTGLPPIFPFTDEQLRQLEEKETTVRACLRRLADWFNETVFAQPPAPSTTVEPKPPPTPSPLTPLLEARWRAELAGAHEWLQTDSPQPSLIPDVQAALECWLKFLHEHRLGGGERWAKVELLQDTDLGPYGYLTVIRPDGLDLPGVGLAAWLAGGRGRERDLKGRLLFFNKKPCPVRTLILFRADGERALGGRTLEVWEKYKVRPGRDVRIQPYDARHLESVVAFPRWLQATRPEVEAAGRTGAAAQRQFAEKLSGELLSWVADWVQPPAGRAS